MPEVALAMMVAGPAMVDAHCRLFNVKDLSAIKLVSQVVLEHYPELWRGEALPKTGSRSI